MRFLNLDDIQVLDDAIDACCPLIYVIDSPEHPFELADLDVRREATLVRVPVRDWNDALTPWPAPGLYRGEPDFGGCAAQTLAELVGEAIPTMEQARGLEPKTRAICGYSLGGLFALYALAHAGAFDACACLSGSVWYEGWVEHLRELDVDLHDKFAFLSVGTKEKRAARPLLRTVQDRMETCAEILKERGCEVRYRTSPGNHMQYVPERFAAGIGALDEFLRVSPLSRCRATDHIDAAP
jgi:predicted alpha/beta superfamily hydrolase